MVIDKNGTKVWKTIRCDYDESVVGRSESGGLNSFLPPAEKYSVGTIDEDRSTFILPGEESKVKPRVKSFTINNKNNFIRIFKIPEHFPGSFCFGGGRPVNFEMIDWFEPYPAYSISMSDVNPKEDPYGGLIPLGETPNYEVTLTLEQRELLNTKIREFIQKKIYYGSEKLLALTSYGDSFIIPAKVR